MAIVGPFAIVGFPGDKPASAKTYLGNDVTNGLHAVIGAGTPVADFTNVSAGVSVGQNTRIGKLVELFHRRRCINGSEIGDEAWVGGFICNRVVVSRRAVVYGRLIHRFVDAEVGVPEDSPIVEDEAFVGESAVLIGGGEDWARSISGSRRGGYFGRSSRPPGHGYTGAQLCKGSETVPPTTDFAVLNDGDFADPRQVLLRGTLRRAR